ncbi:MAG: PqqD family protein [Flavobacteriaceae bacterium]|jgi:hypothetical protein|nr:PqqD family protein [Flavobacteriaceae bacterium]
MKIKTELKIRNIAGENVLIMQGRAGADMTKVISFNPTAEWLWNELSDKEFSEKDVVDLIVNRFKIDENIAKSDAQKWIEQMTSCNAIEK